MIPQLLIDAGAMLWAIATFGLLPIAIISLVYCNFKGEIKKTEKAEKQVEPSAFEKDLPDPTIQEGEEMPWLQGQSPAFTKEETEMTLKKKKEPPALEAEVPYGLADLHDAFSKQEPQNRKREDCASEERRLPTEEQNEKNKGGRPQTIVLPGDGLFEILTTKPKDNEPHILGKITRDIEVTINGLPIKLEKDQEIYLRPKASPQPAPQEEKKPEQEVLDPGAQE